MQARAEAGTRPRGSGSLLALLALPAPPPRLLRLCVVALLEAAACGVRRGGAARRHQRAGCASQPSATRSAQGCRCHVAARGAAPWRTRALAVGVHRAGLGRVALVAGLAPLPVDVAAPGASPVARLELARWALGCSTQWRRPRLDRLHRVRVPAQGGGAGRPPGALRERGGEGEGVPCVRVRVRARMRERACGVSERERGRGREGGRIVSAAAGK